jgi:hypothetical protein
MSLGSRMGLAEPEGPKPMRARAPHPLVAAGGAEPMPIEAGEHEVVASIDRRASGVA